ncbi:MAG: DUF2693 domain-containing protein [Candidatus Methanofastidiosa archaeon]|nr:DUF2693 domain-containing protein [Candidatus Methanofastidiosa archaeon]
MTEQLIKDILTEELFGYKICESARDLFIVNYFYDNLLLEKLLYGEPISVPELRKLLRKKIVNFEFIKLNGEVRPAKGTTMMKYIPRKDHPKGIRPSSPKVATFFDLDKDAWRSVSRRSKEIVLKKDEKTDKPIVVVRDKSRVKVKSIPKYRVSQDPIEQGGTYKYTTNKGTNTYVEIERELPDGQFQVSSPLFKTTFAIDKARIGDRFKPEEPVTKGKEPEPETPKLPKEEKPIKKAIEEPKEEPKEPKKEQPKQPGKAQIRNVKPIPKQQPKPAAKPKPPSAATVLLPQEVQTEEEPEIETKAPPADITPPVPPEEEGPIELKK